MSLLTAVLNAPSASNCLTREDAEKLIEDQADEVDVERFREHLGDCAKCRRTIEDVINRNSPNLPENEPLRETDTGFVRLRDRLVEPDSRSTPDPPLDAPAKPGDLGVIGQYRIQRILGQGGMGIVYLGFDPRLKRTVAIKLLRREPHDLRARKRFVRESRAAAGIQHDNVVTVYSVANPKDAPPYLVMQYIRGKSLRERIAADKQLTPRLAAKIAMQVAKGLSAAHQAGLVHRDVKPANVMLDESDNRAKLTDFGLVRAEERRKEITQEGFTPGTPEYMSPEQFANTAAVDARSDVYGLGITLYEALTGTVPFRGAGHQIMQQVMHDVAPRPRKLNAVVPRDLETICLRAMEKDPGQRYATAREMELDLRNWLRGKPIKARPVGTFGRFLRWRRRQRSTANLACSLVVLVIAAFVAIFWQWRRAEHNLAEFRHQQSETQRHRVASQHHRKKRVASEHEADKQAKRADKAQGQIIDVALQTILRQDNSPKAIQSKFTQQLFAITREAIENGDERVSNRLNVAAAHLLQGNMHREAGKFKEAVAAYETAIEKFNRIRQKDPDDESTIHGLAASRHWLGVAQANLGRPISALANHRAAASVFADLVSKNPDARNYPLDWVQSLIAIADLSTKRDEQQKSLSQARSVLLRVQQTVGKGFDINTQRAIILAYRNLAKGYRNFRDSDSALALARTGCNLAQDIVDRSPKASPFRGELAACLNELGSLLLELKQPAEAVRVLENAVAQQRSITARNLLQPDPRAVEAEFLGNLAVALRAAGRFRDAIETAKKRRELAGWDAEALYSCAVEIAKNISGLDTQAKWKPNEREELQRLACETLQQAVDVGFQDKARLMDDRALDPLRSHVEFAVVLEMKVRKRWRRAPAIARNNTPKSAPQSQKKGKRKRDRPRPPITVRPARGTGLTLRQADPRRFRGAFQPSN